MIRRTTALLTALGAIIILACFVPQAQAEVTRVDITGQATIGASGYEKVFGTAHFAIDPKDPRNRVIVDLDKAAVNPQGKVEFSADFYLMRPTDASKANGVALVEVSNRGRKGLLSGFNRAPATLDPASDADLGDGFLMRQGYTLAWVGWQFDVKSDGKMMSIKAPVAANASTIVRADFTPNDRAVEMTIADLGAYPPTDAAGADTTLTVRDEQYGLPQPVARDKYQLRGNVVSMPGGFEPGRIYQVAYRTKDPAIGGIGLAAFRDFAAWLKHGQQGSANAKWAYAFGSSQSGRFLRTFLYYGFNADEKGQQVFDGVMAHIAGAARLSINEASATPNALGMYTATGFPFADAATRDPVSGKQEGLLDNERARKHQPKVFYTNTAVEYWGGGRSAALIHTTPDGKSDLKVPDNVRIYFLTGAQHSPARYPTRMTTGQQPENPLEYWWTLRALLTSMDRWARQGTPPPASQHPKLADGTLVAATQVAFPNIPGVASPHRVPAARQGETPLPFLVPQVDQDGNERAGVRTPEISVPVATYTGWNFRNPSIGGAGMLVSLMGSAVPFAATKASRAPNDPRPSIEERYPSHERYTELAKSAATALVSAGYLLADDVPQVMQRAEDEWSGARQVAGSR
jgi:hypothetical protein